MQGLTKRVGNSAPSGKRAPINKDEIKKVLICRPNHRLGNLLLITPLVQEIVAAFPDCKIDLFVKGNAALLVFQNYDHVDRLIRLPKKTFRHLVLYIGGWIALRWNRYDLVINPVPYSSSGRLSTKIARGKFKVFGEIPASVRSLYPGYQHVAKLPVYAFRSFLVEMKLRNYFDEIPPLNLKLSMEEYEKGGEILKSIVQNERKTIGFFTYATGEKCYSMEWWGKFYERVKAEYSEYNIIEILPVENISNLGRKVPAFYSRDIREISSLMAHLSLFVGADSGMMHLSGASGIPTIGLFSVTSPDAYGPYGNRSVSVKTDGNDIEPGFKAVVETLAANRL